MPIVALGIAVMESSVHAPISMPMRPSVISTWRPSCTASMHQVSLQCVPVCLETPGTLPQPALPLWLFPGGSSEDGFSAIKLTALGRPQFLVSVRGSEWGGLGWREDGGCFGVPEAT